MVAVLVLLGSMSTAPAESAQPLDQLVSRAAWVCEALGWKPDGQRLSVSGHPSFRSFAFSEKGGRGVCTVVLDENHGRVRSFFYSPRFQPGQTNLSRPARRNDKKAQAVLEKLGYGGWMTPGPDGFFIGAVNGCPILSPFPASQIQLLYRDGKPVSMYGSLTAVKEPKARARITQDEALAKAKSAGARRLRRFADGYASKATKGVVIDSDGRSAKWAWRVEFSSKTKGSEGLKDVFHIDGSTGQPFDLPEAPKLAATSPGVASAFMKLPKWSPPSAPDYRCEGLERAKRRLALLAPYSPELSSYFVGKTSRVAATDGTEMALDGEGRLYLYRGGSKLKAKDHSDGAKSINLAKKLVASEKIRIPEGRYAWAIDPTDHKPSVRFVQTALGLDYLEPTPLTVRFSSNGLLAKFDHLPKLATPNYKPNKILSKPEIQAVVQAWSRSRLTSETSKLWAEERVEALRLGWVADYQLDQVALAWEVRLTSQRIAGKAAKKVKTYVCFFRADTGKYLRAPDARQSAARILSDSLFLQDG